jgi:thiol-disulfide isomerase/thioredoxin
MKFSTIILSLLLIFLVGCASTVEQTQDKTEIQPQQKTESDTKIEQSSDWMEIPLKDVRTKEEYKISDFSGKPILIESFAVWCPTCKRQQQEIKKLHEEVGDSVISIGLDTDPNEDEEKVLSFIEQNNFDWRYSVSPTDLTKALIDEFGQNIVFAPQAPIVLVCKDGSSKLLPRGIKTSEELQKHIEEC